MVGLALIASTSSFAQTQIRPAPTGNQTETRLAYVQAITCFLANGYAQRLRVRAGDDAKAAIYKAHAQASWNLAFGLGQSLAFPNDRIEHDLSVAETEQLPEMVKDQSVFYQNVAMCKARGLM